MQKFDVIVIGCGAVGSATLHSLASAGVNVVGIDRYYPPHDKGSSHGQSRIIRQAYFEHPDYVPLLHEAYRGWIELQEQTDQKLLHQVGLLQVGPVDGFLIPGVLASAAAHQLPLERISGDAIQNCFPGFRAEREMVGLFEKQAGYLLVEESIQAYLDCAQRAGAKIHIHSDPAHWQSNGKTIRVESGTEVFCADRLVITTGSWSGHLLNSLGIELRVVRKHVYWIANESAKYRDGSPVFFFETPRGYFYGFPQLDHRGIKVANHQGGEEVTNPDLLNTSVDPEDQNRIHEFLRKFVPDISEKVTDHQVCMYTRSPDGHFIVDRHPEYSHVVFAAGLSGHGFKFAPALARAIADIISDKELKLPIDFLSTARFNNSTMA